MSTPHWIEARQLNTYYGASHILSDLNFHLGKSETLGLMGRNGMGKHAAEKLDGAGQTPQWRGTDCRAPHDGPCSL